jgi:hypothetical protein
MKDSKIESARSWWTAILRDIQFWIPFGVLVIGLLLLRMIQ